METSQRKKRRTPAKLEPTITNLSEIEFQSPKSIKNNNFTFHIRHGLVGQRNH